MTTRLLSGDTLLFVGDSIIECDRRHVSCAPLGFGFVRMLADMLLVREPEKSVHVINKGIGGNTIAHLLSRWQDDVIQHQPDHLFVLIGINDAMRFVDRSSSLYRAPDDFKEVYVRLIEETHSRVKGCRLTLMQPFFISRGDDIRGSYRSQLIDALEIYIEITGELATQFHLPIIQLPETFKKLLCHKRSDTYSDDGVHPNLAGHYAIAEAVYENLTNKGGIDV